MKFTLHWQEKICYQPAFWSNWFVCLILKGEHLMIWLHIYCENVIFLKAPIFMDFMEEQNYELKCQQKKVNNIQTNFGNNKIKVNETYFFWKPRKIKDFTVYEFKKIGTQILSHRYVYVVVNAAFCGTCNIWAKTSAAKVFTNKCSQWTDARYSSHT